MCANHAQTARFNNATFLPQLQTMSAVFGPAGGHSCPAEYHHMDRCRQHTTAPGDILRCMLNLHGSMPLVSVGMIVVIAGYQARYQQFCIFGTGFDRPSARLQTAKNVLSYPSRHILSQHPHSHPSEWVPQGHLGRQNHQHAKNGSKVHKLH